MLAALTNGCSEGLSGGSGGDGGSGGGNGAVTRSRVFAVKVSDSTCTPRVAVRVDGDEASRLLSAVSVLFTSADVAFAGMMTSAVRVTEPADAT